MKTQRTIIFLSMHLCCIYLQGQVKTNLYNILKFTEKGKFNKVYSKAIDLIFNPIGIGDLYLINYFNKR